jgi:hypothetical protein
MFVMYTWRGRGSKLPQSCGRGVEYPTIARNQNKRTLMDNKVESKKDIVIPFKNLVILVLVWEILGCFIETDIYLN